MVKNFKRTSNYNTMKLAEKIAVSLKFISEEDIVKLLYLQDEKEILDLLKKSPKIKKQDA